MFLQHALRRMVVRGLRRKYFQKGGIAQGLNLAGAVADLCAQRDEHWSAIEHPEWEDMFSSARWLDDVIICGPDAEAEDGDDVEAHDREERLMAWEARTKEDFYGEALYLMPEAAGPIVVFAGTVVIVRDGLPCTRIHNPNADPLNLNMNWDHVSYRFRAGGEFGSGRQAAGQILGHLQRVFDHSNMLSQGFAVL